MSNLESVVKRLEAVAVRLESAAAGKSNKGAAVSAEDDESVEAFDEIISKHLSKLLQLTNTIGSDELKQQIKFVSDAFTAQRNFLVIASKCKQPPAGELPKLLKPISDAISNVQDIKDKNRPSKQFNHLSCIGDWIPIFGWVGVPGKTAKFVQETAAGADFYGNRIKKEFKDQDKNQFDWVNSIKPISEALVEYCKTYHGNGVSWNVHGVAVGDAPKPSGPPAPAGGAPPPPPPVAAAAPAASSGSKVADMGALFSELNKGANVTTGLKKVDPSMQTHKNPNLRTGSKVPAKAPSSSAPKQIATVKASAPTKAPIFQKVGKKWVVEHQIGNKAIVINDCNMKEAIYVFKCIDSVIQVNSKINSITLDSCKKTGVVFQDVLSTCEFVNCQSVQAQANGQIPTFSIDKTDGCQLYLNEKNCNVDIVTAKSSEMNVMIVKADGDLKEYPIPEQFKTRYNGKGLTTDVLDSV